MPDDKQLVSKARSGDEESFRLLIRRYQGDVLNLAQRILRNREDAQDAVQEVFIRLHRSLDQYDTKHAFRSWLLRITHNICIDQIRKRKPGIISIHDPIMTNGGEMDWDLPDARADDPLDVVIEGQEKSMLEAAIAALNPILRSAITMRHVHGLRYEEIAEVLDIPLGTVKVRIFRARSALAKQLGGRLERGEE